MRKPRRLQTDLLASVAWENSGPSLLEGNFGLLQIKSLRSTSEEALSCS